jgi:hypothetical protein
MLRYQTNAYPPQCAPKRAKKQNAQGEKLVEGKLEPKITRTYTFTRSLP